MLNRHKIRILVLQTLFEVEFCAIDDYKKAIEIYNRLLLDESIKSDGRASKFAETLIKGILTKSKELDEIIAKVAPAWPIEKIPTVDKNILRISIFEILFGKDFETPPRVAINEAIEISKEFGSDSTSKFVNGVLGTIYKNTDSQKVDKEVRKLKKSIGALAYTIKGKEVKFGILNDVFGKWTLSKCGILEDETDDAAVMRVLKEELGINCIGVKKIGKNAYTAHNPKDGPVRNEVTYYVAKCDNTEIKLKKSGGLKDADWFTYGEAKSLPMYKDLRPMIEGAMREVVEKEESKMGI